MKWRFIKGMVTGALIGIIAIMLFPNIVAYLYSFGSSNYVFVDFFADGPYVTYFNGKYGVMVPVRERVFVGAVDQFINGLDSEELSIVGNALGSSYTVTDVVSYASEHFVYNLAWRTEYKPLKSSMRPSEFLSVGTGVCGDYAMFYAAALLNCCSEATVEFIYPYGDSIGHVFVAYSGTALSYKTIKNLESEFMTWYQVYGHGRVLELVLTNENNTVHPVRIALWSFSNTITVTFPETIDYAVVTRCVGTKLIDIVTTSSFIVYPPVVGSSTVCGKTITIMDKCTYLISDNFFAKVSSRFTIIVKYYGTGSVRFYYGLVKTL